MLRCARWARRMEDSPGCSATFARMIATRLEDVPSGLVGNAGCKLLYVLIYPQQSNRSPPPTRQRVMAPQVLIDRQSPRRVLPPNHHGLSNPLPRKRPRNKIFAGTESKICAGGGKKSPLLATTRRTTSSPPPRTTRGVVSKKNSCVGIGYSCCGRRSAPAGEKKREEDGRRLWEEGGGRWPSGPLVPGRTVEQMSAAWAREWAAREALRKDNDNCVSWPPKFF